MAVDDIPVSGGSGYAVRAFNDGTHIWQGVVSAFITGGSAGAWTTQYQTAAALADATANPTTYLAGSCLHGFNGSTWDRLQVDASKFLKVNVAAPFPAAAALADATANPTTTLIGSMLHGFNGTTWDRLLVDASKFLKVNIAGQAATITVQPGNTPNSTPWLVTPVPDSTGTQGFTSVLYTSQTTTVQTVKASAGSLCGWHVFNPNTSVAYLQIFDVAGSVTLGTTTPKLSLGIPAGGGANLLVPLGISFANTIKLACTTTETGSTAPASGLTVNIFYK